MAPPCTMFALLATCFGKLWENFKVRVMNAVKLAFLAAAVARWQLRRGNDFLIESPQASRLWKLKFFKELHERFPHSTVDQCTYGLKTPDGRHCMPKATTF